MSDLFGIGSIISGGANAAATLGAAAMNLQGQMQANSMNFEIANRNLLMQQEQQQYMRDLQQTMFNREDTSIQRRRADLEAAGMNPVLAAGQGAQAGPVVQMQAPQSGYRHENPYAGAAQNIGALGNILPMMLQLEGQRQSIAQSQAQTRLTNAEASKVESETPIKIEALRLSNLIADQTLSLNDQELVARKIENQFNADAFNDRLLQIELLNRNYSQDYLVKVADTANKIAQEAYIKAQTDVKKEEYGTQLEQTKLVGNLNTKAMWNALQAEISARIDEELYGTTLESAKKQLLILGTTLSILQADQRLKERIDKAWEDSGISPVFMDIIKGLTGAASSTTGAAVDVKSLFKGK